VIPPRAGKQEKLVARKLKREMMRLVEFSWGVDVMPCDASLLQLAEMTSG
jgi:hypothetical protein